MVQGRCAEDYSEADEVRMPSHHSVASPPACHLQKLSILEAYYMNKSLDTPYSYTANCGSPLPVAYRHSQRPCYSYISPPTERRT